jgi:hypothetical protein
MAAFQDLEKLRKQGEEIELTDEQLAKFQGDCYPGCKVRIYWETGYGDKYTDDGYVFVVDGMDAEIADCFIHVPDPENLGGKDRADPEWVYMTTLLANPYVTKIVCK